MCGYPSVSADNHPVIPALRSESAMNQPVEERPGRQATAAAALFEPGNWTQTLDLSVMFDFQRTLEIDVGCGKGRFLLARARNNPDVNYIGIDRMVKRLRKLDRKIDRTGLDNVRLLKTEASYAFEELLPPASANAIYTFFPDPWPKRRHHRRRLFCPAFCSALARVLAPRGHLHVSTDHLEYLAEISDLMLANGAFEPVDALALSEEERTNFEKTFLGLHTEIGRCSFRRMDVARSEQS